MNTKMLITVLVAFIVWDLFVKDLIQGTLGGE